MVVSAENDSELVVCGGTTVRRGVPTNAAVIFLVVVKSGVSKCFEADAGDVSTDDTAGASGVTATSTVSGVGAPDGVADVSDAARFVVNRSININSTTTSAAAMMGWYRRLMGTIST